MPRDDTATGNLHDVLADDLRRIHGITGGPGSPPTEKELRAIAPRPVPSLVLSIGARSAAGVSEAISRIPDALDDTVGRYPVKIEVRADRLPGFSDRMTAIALVLRLGVPVIVTLRARQEGGDTTLTEPERQRFFLSMAGALRGAPPPGSIVDIEAAAVANDPEGWGQVIEQVREKGFQVLLSHHDLTGTPHDDHGLLPDEGLLDTCPGGPAALWKAATTVNSWSDELALIAALRRGNAATRRAAIMGMGSPVARLVAPFFAAPLVYAAIGGEDVTAPGQIPFGDLARTWTRWGVTVDDTALVAPADDNGYAPRWILIGRPAWHSLSPAMHNAAAREQQRNERYFPLELPEFPSAEDETEAFDDTLLTLRSLGVTAGNVTIPFKQLLAGTADRLDGDAEALGVANTFRFDDGRLSATNTDTIGTRNALEEAGVDVANARVLVIGAGGSAAAAAYALRDAKHLAITNRTEEHAKALAERIGKHAHTPAVTPWDQRAQAAKDADVIVHCTSIGMTGGPAPDDSPIPQDALHKAQTVLDLVYVPRRTPLLRAAEEAGATTVDGTNVLLHQGAAAYAYWTGTKPPLDTMRRAMAAADTIPFPASVRAAEAVEVNA